MPEQNFDPSEMTIEAWPIERPVPSENNNKLHTDESVQKLAKSMDKLGQLQAILVDKDDVIIAGHGRQLAAQSLGWNKLKVIQVNVDRETAIKMRIADNLMSNQNYDQEAIGRDLSGIEDFDPDDLDAMIGDDKLRDLVSGDLSKDLGIDEDALSEDIAGDVSDFSEENDQRMREIEDEETPLRRAFGFDKLKPAQVRLISRFMAMVSEETGLEDPREALVQWIEEVVE